MSRLPFVLRVAVGAVALAAEKGQEIASGAVSAPITLGSMSAQAFIRMQQDLAELAVRGDHTLETIFPPKEEEQPQWATFDDDEDVDVDLPSPPAVPFGTVRPGAEKAEKKAEEAPATSAPEPEQPEAAPSGAGRYALYSSPAPSAAAPGPDTADLDLPDAVRRLDYPELTLAQLRGRLASLSSDDLAALLAFEREHKARAPFLTMLENRLNR
ncbi:lipid droplet-associated protein [Tsukamurella strandjordii]|uniref:Lipid droplet-associated protein n=1 Tax=Tsukamurella strandjordii TaxID=147577 RepID=A0AA90NL79_9ACTN|nr:lipid droplet-associated protein [Tsukamurella strandjordii]MDP0400406.1 lipid droplet-associated protein [Tsukamurella strandjordii]